MKIFRFLSFFCLFFFCALIADSAFAVGNWVNGPLNSSYQYNECINGGTTNHMLTFKTTATANCDNLAGNGAYRFNAISTFTESVCKKSDGSSGGQARKYQCQVNPDPCPEGQDWDQETQQCVEPPPPVFTCDGEPGTVIGPSGDTCVPIECAEGQKLNGSVCEPDCPTDSPILSGPVGFTFTCKGGCALSSGSKGICISSGGSQSCDYSYTGQNCDSSSQNENVATAQNECADCGTNENMSCPAGQVYFSMGATSGCFDVIDTDPVAPPSPTTTETTTTETTTTTTNPDGSTTTTTTSTSGSSSSGGSSGGSGGSSSGSSVKTITTTVNPDGSTTTTVSEVKEEPSLNTPSVDTSGSGSFWETNYPDGLAGIWAKHQAALSTSSVANWLNSWSFDSSGSCPSFSFSFDVGFISFGSQSIPTDIYCYVFPVVRIFFIISALLLARRLVFGG